MPLDRTESCARRLDGEDTLARFREEFHVPSIYLCGNSLGEILARLTNEGVVCDFREPDILRVAPVPLYNRFLDVYRFVQVLEEVL
jgi:kynureninase